MILQLSKNNMTNARHIFIFDLIRMICMIWVVFIWHLNDYLPIGFHFSSITLCICEKITIAALFIFTLLSGYSMAKYSFQCQKDVLIFYKKRFVRFYPLYLIAILCFYAYGWYSKSIVLKCMTGIVLFFNDAPYTLWYMCMLMFFYMITPILNWKYSSYKKNIIMYLIAVILFGILSMLDITHENMAYYMPAYVLGLYLGNTIHIPSKVYTSPIEAFVSLVAYSSFCIYLFHRVIFATVANIFNEDWIVGSILIPMTLPCALVAVISVIIVSYGIQKCYDAMLIKLKNNFSIVKKWFPNYFFRY